MSLYRIFKNISKVEGKPLLEGVEYLKDSDHNTHYFRDDDVNTYAFAIVSNRVITSKRNDTHGNAVIDHFKLIKNGFLDRNEFDKIYKSIYYSGRIWLDYNVIAFWNSYVPEVILQDVINHFKKMFPDYTIEKFNIEYGRK